MMADALLALRAVVLGPDQAPASRRRAAMLWPGLAVAVAGYVLAGLGSVRLEVAPPLVRAALAVAAVGPVALLHSSPLIAWRAGVLATLVTVPVDVAPEGLAWPWHPVQLLIVPATVFAVALRHRTTVVVWVAVLSCPAMLVRVSPQDAATVIAGIALVAVTGVQVRRLVTARRTAEQTRRALLEQRTSIARELHDVVGHHMSLIAVRAESAPYRLLSRPEAQQSEFAAIADASREALNDMRHLVGTLRAGDRQPGVAGLRALVDAARSAGLAVSADLDPAIERTAVPGGPGLTVYRLVQEALSNAARHAPGSTVEVTARLVDDRVRVGVHNAAATRPGRSNPDHGRAGGSGLTGMRERVLAAGGTVSIGPTGDGGFRVDADVPLHRTTPAGSSRGQTDPAVRAPGRR